MHRCCRLQVCLPVAPKPMAGPNKAHHMMEKCRNWFIPMTEVGVNRVSKWGVCEGYASKPKASTCRGKWCLQNTNMSMCMYSRRKQYNTTVQSYANLVDLLQCMYRLQYGSLQGTIKWSGYPAATKPRVIVQNANKLHASLIAINNWESSMHY